MVLITGGGSGIGACFVEQFARRGAKVGFVDIDDDSSERLVAALSTDATMRQPSSIAI